MPLFRHPLHFPLFSRAVGPCHLFTSRIFRSILVVYTPLHQNSFTLKECFRSAATRRPELDPKSVSSFLLRHVARSISFLYDAMLVFHTPLSLTHDPPKEILSGCAQPYFESPARVTRILSALLDPECRDGSEFEERCCDWTREEVASDAALLQAVARVHDPVYLDFLREIYAEWIEEGGSKVSRLYSHFELPTPG